MIEKEFGKIRDIKLGFGGYQDAMLGVTFKLESKEWGTIDFWPWSGSMEFYVKIRDLLRDAEKQDLKQLEGVPIEVTFENGVLKSWRILKEVL